MFIIKMVKKVVQKMEDAERKERSRIIDFYTKQ
jgi:uncharacterized protein (UPF0335 family)